MTADQLNDSSMNQKVTIAIVAFLLGLIFYWAFLDKSRVNEVKAPESEFGKLNATSTPALVATPKQKSSKESVKETPGAIAAPVKGVYEVVAKDQAAGSSAKVENISVASDAWVAIHNEINGKPGVILGARRFRKGTYNNQDIKLFIKPMESGMTYYAIIHGDDGDPVFDYQKDLPLTVSGTVVIRTYAVEN